MRGIYTAAFLDRLTDQQARRTGSGPLDLGRGFDLVVGTSTGAMSVPPSASRQAGHIDVRSDRVISTRHRPPSIDRSFAMPGSMLKK